MDILVGKNINVRFGAKAVLENVNIQIPKGKRTAIIGPNGSGKSTILKALAGLISYGGRVLFEDKDIRSIGRRTLAREVAVLPQSPKVPADLTVGDLVEYGRFPHRAWWSFKQDQGAEAVDWALDETGIGHLKHRLVHTLSGGERQRAWIAMALAQKPNLLMLDEPTTYLDISHQLEVMQIVSGLHENNGLSIVMVLHDINHAMQFADHVVVVKDGKIRRAGQPEEVISTDLLEEVFGVRAEVFTNWQGKSVFAPLQVIKSDK